MINILSVLFQTLEETLNFIDSGILIILSEARVSVVIWFDVYVYLCVFACICVKKNFFKKKGEMS